MFFIDTGGAHASPGRGTMTGTKDVIQICTDNIPDIWEKYRRLAFRVAMPFIRIYPSQTEDIEQECFLSVVDAVEHYNPDAGDFAVYMPNWVRERVGRYCRRNGCAFSIPEYQFGRLRRLRDARDKTGHVSTCLAGMTEEQVQNTDLAARALSVSSLSDLVRDADGLTLADMVEDKENGIDEAVDRIAMQELHSNLSKLLLCVSKTDREYIKRHYYGGQSYADIGKDTGEKAGNVSSHVHTALGKMRRKARRLRDFDEYLDGRTRSKALRGGCASFNTSWTSSTEHAAIDRIEQKMRVNWDV